MKRYRRILSFVLVCCILVTMFPISVLATNTEPQLTDLILSYYFEGKWQEMSILGKSELPQVTYTASRGFTFKAIFENPEDVGTVYFVDQKDNKKTYLEAIYNEDINAFVANGFFNDDESYIPGRISIEYTLKTPDAFVTDSIDWSSITIDGIDSNQMTIKNQSNTSIETTIDFSKLVDSGDPLQQVLVDTTIEIFDENSGANFDDFLGAYKDLDKLLSYTVEGKDNKKYIVYQEANQKNYWMLVKDITGNKYIKMILSSDEKFDDISSVLSGTNTVSSIIYDYCKVLEDTDKLRNEISVSDLNPEQRTQAFQKIDRLENDKVTFSLATAVLPLITTVFSVSSAPAVLFSAFLSVITSSADYFWDNRVGMIKSEVVDLNLIAYGSCHAPGYTKGGPDWFLNKDGTLTISGEGDMADYDFSIRHCPWRSFANQIKTIIIEPGVTNIGANAFNSAALSHPSYQGYGYDNLTSITIPNTVQSIGDGAFNGCIGLVGTLTIPEGVTSIGENAFRECIGFTGSLYIPNGVAVIGDRAFEDCTGFDGTLTLSDNLITVGRAAFKGCKNFTGSLIIPNSVTKIGYSAFLGCYFGDVKLGNSVETIDQHAFQLYSGVKSPLYVPASVLSIGESAFDFDTPADIYFEGDAPSVVGKVESMASFGSGDVTLYYIPDRNGWINSNAYSAEEGTWNGYKLLPWSNSSCVHEFTSTIIKPTCTEQGYTVHTCSKCNNSYKDSYVSALGHSYGEWVITIPATVTTNGQRERICSRCNNKEAEPILATGGNTECKHTYNSKVTVPTCTERGYTTYTCSKCGNSYKDSYVNALGHSYGEWVITIPATVTTNGQRERICSRCNNKETGVISATGSGSSSGGGSSSGSTTNSTNTSNVSTGTTVEGNTSTIKTTAVPSANTKNNIATITVDGVMGNEIVKQAVANSSESVVISPKVTGNVTKIEASILAATVNEIGNRTNANLIIATPVADVTIPHGSMSSLSSGNGTVKVIANRTESTIELSVTANSKMVENLPEGLTLIMPISNATPGTVAVLVHADGTRMVIRKSVADKDDVTIPLNGSAKIEIVDNSKQFSDVPSNNWAADAVAFASAHELFNGTGASKFSPDLPMSRGMLAVVLHNLESNPDQSVTDMFTDVNNDDWYVKGVTWAASKGIVSGYGNGVFGPNDNITREQLAVMLWRYSGSPSATNKELKFNDADEISSFALEAMHWAVEDGILNGYDDGRLGPQGQATRAQVAQMLKKYLER